MTTNFGQSPNDTQAGLRMPTNSNEVIGPEKFAEICRGIVTQHEGHAAHRMLDQVVTNLLSSLGYGEGMEIFLAHVGSYHTDEEGRLHIEFGKELVFAALGLKSQEAGTVAKFSIEIDGMKRDVRVSVSEGS